MITKKEMIKYAEEKGSITKENLIKDSSENIDNFVYEHTCLSKYYKEFMNAISRAKEYGLDYEVWHSIIIEGMTPEEALREWDC